MGGSDRLRIRAAARNTDLPFRMVASEREPIHNSSQIHLRVDPLRSPLFLVEKINVEPVTSSIHGISRCCQRCCYFSFHHASPHGG